MGVCSRCVYSFASICFLQYAHFWDIVAFLFYLVPSNTCGTLLFRKLLIAFYEVISNHPATECYPACPPLHLPSSILKICHAASTFKCAPCGQQGRSSNAQTLAKPRSRWQKKARAGPATEQAAKDREEIECILIIAVMELQSKLHHRGR